ncbi:MAG: hypothetical protein AAB468_02860 [Patescibacteria group bacterium]
MERDGKPVPDFDKSTVRLRKAILSELGGMTLIKMKDAIGDTKQWGPEKVRLILVITGDVERANDLFVELSSKGNVLRQFNQEEIWVVRQQVGLFRADFRPRARHFGF